MPHLRAGEEIRTPDVQLGYPNVVTRKAQSGKELTATPSARCTPRCTENEIDPHGDPLAGFVASLTPPQRQRLADLLAGSKKGDAS